MKKSNTKLKTNISKIPYSKTSVNKNSLKLSKNYKLKIKNDSIKDTFYGSIGESQTYQCPIPENLKNSKIIKTKDSSFSKKDNNFNIFTYSLKNSINQRNKSSNFSNKEIFAKTQEEYSENISSSEENDFKSLEKSSLIEGDDDTNKIDYRYFPKIPEIEGKVDKNKSFFWLATYDKLMKKSKIVKILSYYSDSLSQRDSEIFVIEDAHSDYKEEESKERLKKLNEKYNFKEKTMVIQGYEIYFVKKHSKPFVRHKKGGKIFIKLYLLSPEQINQIFSYINRLEYKKYIDDLNLFKQKNSFRIINNFNKTIYNYTKIFCLGTFMNTNIYMFSHTLKNKDLSEYENNDFYNSNYLVNNLPSCNKIAKIIKVLMINFPEFSKQYFIDYLMKPSINIFSSSSTNHDLELISQKINKVNSLLITDNKNYLKNKNNNTNNIIKKTIRAIPTNTLSSKNTTNDLNSINYINNDVNCSDFLSNIKNELDGIKNISKYKNKKENEIKIYKSKTNKIKSNNMVLTRNNQSIFDDINNINDSYMKSHFEKKINKENNTCRTISLLNPNKKSLTRNNSNYFIQKNKDGEKDKQNINNIIKLDKKTLYKNKENDLNLLGKNLVGTYNSEATNFIYNNKTKQINKIKHELNRTDSNNNFGVAKLKNNNTYSPYYTNVDITEKNSINKSSVKIKKPIRVLKTVEKLISNKINRIMVNTNSVFQINNNYSNNSFKTQNNRYGNESINDILKSNKQKNIKYKTNNNSQNKKSDYITPLKKKFFYYYH